MYSSESEEADSDYEGDYSVYSSEYESDDEAEESNVEMSDPDEPDVDDGEEEGEGEGEDESAESEHNDTQQADSIVNAFDSLFPEPAASGGMVAMTNVGYRMSRLVLDRDPRPQASPNHDDDLGEDKVMAMPDERDKLLERHLEGRRRNRTGVRGRPRKEDHGFGRSTTVSMAPEVARLMGTANQAYVQREYERAIPLLLEVIRQSPTSFEPYHTLGYIYEELGAEQNAPSNQDFAHKAYSCYLIAAYLAKRDAELWGRLVRMALQLGRQREALLCLSKQILSTSSKRAGEEYIRLHWQRTRLQLQLGDYNAILASLVPMLRANLQDSLLWWRVCQLAIRLKLPGQLAGLIRALMRRSSTAVVGWEHLGWMLELWLAAEEWSRVEASIEEWAPRLAAPLLSTATDWALIGPHERLRRALPLLPPAVQAQQAIAWINAGQSERVHLRMLALLLADLPQARLALGMALLEKEHWREAHELLEPLLHDPNVGSNEVWLAVARCLRQLGRPTEAIDLAKAVLEWEPEHPEALEFLAGESHAVKPPAPAASDDLVQFFDRLVEQSGEEVVNVEALQDTAAAVRGASLLAIPNPRHARKPAHLRKKRRKRVRVLAYTPSQCSQMRTNYERVLAAPDPHTLVTLSQPMVDDLVGNGSVRVDRVSLSFIHSLVVDEGTSLP